MNASSAEMNVNPEKAYQKRFLKNTSLLGIKSGIIGVFGLTLCLIFGLVNSNSSTRTSSGFGPVLEEVWRHETMLLSNLKLTMPVEIIGNIFSIFNESFNEPRFVDSS